MARAIVGPRLLFLVQFKLEIAKVEIKRRYVVYRAGLYIDRGKMFRPFGSMPKLGYQPRRRRMGKGQSVCISLAHLCLAEMRFLDSVFGSGRIVDKETLVEGFVG